MHYMRFEVELYGENITDQVERFEYLYREQIKYEDKFSCVRLPEKEVILYCRNGTTLITNFRQCKIKIYD